MKKIIILLLAIFTINGYSQKQLSGLQKKVLTQNAKTIDKIISEGDYSNDKEVTDVLCLIADEFCNTNVTEEKEYIKSMDRKVPKSGGAYTSTLEYVTVKGYPVLYEENGKAYIIRKNPAKVVAAMKALKKLKYQ